MRQLIYPAPGLAVSEPPTGFETVEWALDGGASAHGWYWRGNGGGEQPAVLFLHGNGENLETMRLSGSIERLLALGVPFVALDYPGYGRSSGRPSESTLLAAAAEVVTWLGQRHPESPIVVVGWSLGAAVALRTAADSPKTVDAVAAFSAWTSLADVARIHFPSWLVRLVLSERYDSLEAVGRLRCPVLLVHGTDDSIIPAADGRTLAEKLGEQARWIEIDGAGHNDLLARERVWAELGAFLQGAARVEG